MLQFLYDEPCFWKNIIKFNLNLLYIKDYIWKMGTEIKFPWQQSKSVG